VDPALRVGRDRLLRNGDDDDRDAAAARGDLLHELRSLDPALQQRVDHDDVRPELRHLAEGLAAVGHDVEQLDGRLGVEEVANVLGDLRDVFDEDQADLLAA